MALVEQINSHFLALAEELARQLHTRWIIEQKFKKQIPIIIYELEYYDKIAEHTQSANPTGLADEFVGWVKSYNFLHFSKLQVNDGRQFECFATG